MLISADVKGVGKMQNRYTVIIEAGEQYLPIFITRYQAEAIHFGLSEEEFERPHIHGLILNIINEIGGELDIIVIDDLIENIFYAKIHIETYSENKRREHVIDARSSDAIALAVRTKCPIELEEKIIEGLGVKEGQIKRKGL